MRKICYNPEDLTNYIIPPLLDDHLSWNGDSWTRNFMSQQGSDGKKSFKETLKD